MSKQGLYLRGYKSITVLLISTIFVAIAYYLYSKIEGIRRHLFLITLLLSISITALIGFTSLDSYDKNNYFSNSQYRIERFFNMGPYKPPKLFVKSGLFEKRYDLIFQNEPIEPFFKKEVDSIKIIKAINNYQVTFYLTNHRVYKTQTKN